MPKIEVSVERCKGCQYCIAACPKKILQMAEGFNSKGYHPVECIDMGECTGCALCAMMCPDVAIDVYK